MNGQATLFDAEPVPRPMTEFLSGVAARYAFGENPTAAEKRAAAAAGAEMASVLAALKSARPATS